MKNNKMGPQICRSSSGFRVVSEVMTTGAPTSIHTGKIYFKQLPGKHSEIRLGHSCDRFGNKQNAKGSASIKSVDTSTSADSSKKEFDFTRKDISGVDRTPVCRTKGSR
jgi:hypothetical protein